MSDSVTDEGGGKDTHKGETFAGDTIWKVPPFMPEVGDTWLGALRVFTAQFNQAYVVNSVADKMGEGVAIEGMGQIFSGGEGDITDYYVEIALDKETLYVESAVFTGIRTTAVENIGNMPVGQMSEGEFPEIIFASDTGDMGTGLAGGEVYSGFYPVCTIQGGDVTAFSRRDNIELSDRQFKQMGHKIAGCPRSEEEVGLGDSGSGWGGSGEAHILIKEGKGAPPVRVRSIAAGSGICVTQEENTIIIDSSAVTGLWSGINTDRNWFEVYGEAPQFTHPDGTALVPAKFRTLEEGSGIKMSYQGQDVDGNWHRIKFDVNMTGDQLSGLWSGKCCGDNDRNTFCVYQEANDVWPKGQRSYGTPDDPAIFRRLTGAGNIELFRATSDGSVGHVSSNEACLIIISGASGCCSGVENVGYEDTPYDPEKGARVYQGGNDPAMLRRLSGAGMLADADGKSILREDHFNDFIAISGIWSGTNTPEVAGYGYDAVGINIYRSSFDEFANSYDGTLAHPAQFRSLTGIGGIETKYHLDEFGYDHMISISGATPAWSGENNACTNGASVYEQPDTPPDGTMSNPALFRQLIGANNLQNAGISAEDYQINVLEEDDDYHSTTCVRIRGNGINGSLTIASGLSIGGESYNELVPLTDGGGNPVNIELVWKDGLIITSGDFIQVYNPAE